MQVLIAEDENITRRLLRGTLERSGYDVVEAKDGEEALERLVSRTPPPIALLDWNMPEMTGPEVCKAVRDRGGAFGYVYMLLLTARMSPEDAVKGLEAGADDFVRKPFDPPELIARIRVGERIHNLESSLEKKIAELIAEQKHVQQLQGLLPICMHCRKVRSGTTQWQKMETYLEKHAGARLSHGLCETCMNQYYPEGNGDPT